MSSFQTHRPFFLDRLYNFVWSIHPLSILEFLDWVHQMTQISIKRSNIEKYMKDTFWTIFGYIRKTQFWTNFDQILEFQAPRALAAVTMSNILGVVLDVSTTLGFLWEILDSCGCVYLIRIFCVWGNSNFYFAGLSGTAILGNN